MTDSTKIMLEGSSIEDLKTQAAAHFNVSEDKVSVNVIDEEKSFFGLFGRRLRAECEVTLPQQQSQALTLAQDLLNKMGMDVYLEQENDRMIQISGEDAQFLIDSNGVSLKALDYLVNLINSNSGPCPRVHFDAHNFRNKRAQELDQLAFEAAKETMSTKRTVFLPPMENWERRLVHLALKDSLVVETHSLGLEPHRRVAIRLKGQGAKDWSDEERKLVHDRRPRYGQRFNSSRHQGHRSCRPNGQRSHRQYHSKRDSK